MCLSRIAHDLFTSCYMRAGPAAHKSHPHPLVREEGPVHHAGRSVEHKLQHRTEMH